MKLKRGIFIVDIRVGNDRGLATNPFKVKKDKKTGIPVKLQFP